MANSDNHREIAELTDILQSKALRQVLSDRKGYLQNEVNKYVRQQEWTEAFGALSKLDDLDKLMDIVTKRAEDLKKEDK